MAVGQRPLSHSPVALTTPAMMGALTNWPKLETCTISPRMMPISPGSFACIGTEAMIAAAVMISVPREVGHFIPESSGGFDSPQSIDVDVDKRGLVYLLDATRVWTSSNTPERASEVDVVASASRAI